MSRTRFRVNPHYCLPEWQGSPYSKEVPYLKFKWQQDDLNPEPLKLKNKHLTILPNWFND